jgi:hypothetical protein
MAIIENRSTEIGDVIRIKTEVPVIGLLFLDTFTDSTEGESPSAFFYKQFRYSNDAGLNFTAWQDLNTINIQDVQVEKKDQFIIEYRYESVGTMVGSDLVFNSITVSGDFENLDYPIYDSTLYKQFFDVNDINVLGWALNVLEKLYRNGILPEYLQRNDDSMDNTEDKDFITYWSSITHFFALIVYYYRQYQNIIGNKQLIKEFLASKDIVIPVDENLTDLSYLLYNYIDEYRKRGTERIYYKKGENNEQIDGELLRSIGFTEPDEFILGLLENSKIGWCIGVSSPTWTETTGCTNLIKGYEYTKSFVGLTKYPIIAPQFVSISEDISVGEDVMVITGHADFLTDIGVSVVSGIDEQDKLIKVSPKLDYEVSFRIKKGNTNNDNLYFGAKVYDKDFNLISTTSVTTGNVTNSFFSTIKTNRLPIENQYYWYRGVLFNSEKTQDGSLKLNFEDGQGLILPEEAVYISPDILVTGNVGSFSPVSIYDIKVRPLNLPFSQGQIGIKNVITGYLLNKGELSFEKLKEFIQNKLIPYNSFLKIKEIK